jgi:flagellar basal body-associated protein FliL
MLKKQMGGLTPTKLRIVLISFIVLLLALCAGGFWFFRHQLVSYAEQVQADNAAASSSSDDIAKLQKMKKDLEENQVAVTRAKNIVADSQQYQYQDQIINEIQAYAKSSKVSITGFVFNSATVPTAGAGATTAVQPATPVGLKSTSVSVTVKSPVNYQSVLRFIHSLELNLTKMQLTGVSLSKVSGSKTDITLNPLTIEVYTR